MDFDISFLEEKGIDVNTGIEYTGNKQKYIAALRRFFNSFEDNSSNIRTYFDKGDLENYCIVVHALKSNSKMIGAADLSRSFEILESAASEGDSSFIAENSKKAMADYKELVELLRPIGEANFEPPSDEIDSEMARSVIEDILAALDDFDDEKSFAMAKKLSGYPFRLTQKEKMDQALKYISDFRYDDAAQIINELRNYIE